MFENLGSRLMDGLLALLSASLDQLFQVPASLLVWGLIARWGRHEPFAFFDVASLAVALFCVSILVRRMYRSPVRSLAGIGRMYPLPKGTEGPTASWAHFLWDGIWLCFGIALMSGTTVTGPEGAHWQPGLGIGFLIVAGILLPLRLIFRYKHRAAG